jgi:CBS domain-containing protein
MTLYAKDIMVTNFETIHKDAPIEESIEKISSGIVRETGYKTISLMVIDDFNKLSGVISMFDILYHLRPDFLNFGIDSEELKWEGQLKVLIEKFKEKKVHHIMSRNIIGAAKDDHVMILLDRMVKNKYRRIPVLDNDKPVGVVYISDIYHRLFSQEMI